MATILALPMVITLHVISIFLVVSSSRAEVASTTSAAHVHGKSQNVAVTSSSDFNNIESEADGITDSQPLHGFLDNLQDFSAIPLAPLHDNQGAQHIAASANSVKKFSGYSHDALTTVVEATESVTQYRRVVYKIEDRHNRVFHAVIGICLSLIFILMMVLVGAFIYAKQHGWMGTKPTVFKREESIFFHPPRRVY